MKLISWNVAGFRACLKKGFDDFFKEVNADVFCMQEAKVTEDQFDYKPEGYEMYLYPAEKKGYSGTLVYSRVKPLNVTYGLGIEEHDHEGRVITMEFEKFFLIDLYVPNVKRDLSRLDYRMTWEDDFRAYLKKLEQSKPVVVCGDFNVAHEEIDIKNAKSNRGNAGFTDEERAKFTELLNADFIDTYRHFHPDEERYTWWSYMGNARAKNVGWRLDYFVISKDFLSEVEETRIYDEVMGSDHCPVGLTVKD
ncbi:MAG: exodeoxyribonuclease III [Clostridia bacterium]|nr:exodeoxyribonuclease III [Clostridia bacterium]